MQVLLTQERAIIHKLIGGDASMTALSNNQSLESFQQFQSGSNKRKRMEEEYPSIIENMYVNKKQKTSTQQFRRGRFEFDQLGILRTKPGIQNDATVVHN